MARFAAGGLPSSSLPQQLKEQRFECCSAKLQTHKGVRWERTGLLCLFVSICPALVAQADRIKTPINDSQLVMLKGNLSPRAQPKYDQGPLAPATKLSGMRITFKPSRSQKADLDRLLSEQQDPGSPNYHKWLTPQQYADRFGLSRRDIGKVVAWLKSQGFTVTEIAHGRGWVVFSGTAGQVKTAFHTEIHRYVVDGETHFANSVEPSIPKALAGVVSGLSGLNDFRPKPMSRPKVKPLGPVSLRSNPDFTSGGSNFLAPDDIATIYDISKLYAQGYDGTGQAIAVVGQSDIHTSDLSNFWSAFGLTPPTLNQVIDPNTGDPGFTGAEIEADLDLETVSGIARNATIYYVFGTNAVDAAAYVIDNPSLIPVSVINISFGACEPAQSAALFPELESMAEQGNSEGITFAASSGDTGAAGCESNNGTISSATTGLAVSVPASVPEVTGVGGTEFSGDVNNQSQYWSGTNSPTDESALSYIPEMAWNDSDVTGAGPLLDPTLAASGGGASIAFKKPSWQVGSGVPADGARDVPDISITASANHDGYVIFCSDTSSGCPSGGGPGIEGGTSAAAPVFSSILVLLNHYLVKNGVQSAPGLGNINETLYQFAQSNSSAFHDITTGSNIVPCTNPSPNCPTTPPFQFGYSASVGYDQVTGLGSIDAYNFVTGWASALKTPTTTTQSITATPSSSQSNAGSLITFTAKVAHSSGSGAPTGTVTFSNGSTVLAVGNVNATGIATYATSSLAVGTYSVTASYSGDTNYAGSTSAAVTFNVVDFTIAASSTSITVASPGQSGQTTLTITPLSGFIETLSYSCSGLPSESTCAFAAVSATTETLTIQTTAPSARLDKGLWGPVGRLFYAFLLPGFFGFLATSGRRKSQWRIIGLSLGLGLAILILGCGGSSSTNNTPSNPGTPTGTSQIKVTATTAGPSALSHQIQVTLSIQ
jgi:subtilase family serine protease